jgi:DNA-binding transcriptional LysR family regulator
MLLLQDMDTSDLGLLLHLDALLQEGSVTRAARRIALSTPAMSHALARIRDRLGDPILVRSGRGMLLTPRAEALKPRVHAVVNDARNVLQAERLFVAAELQQSFVVHVTDYVLSVFGLVVDRILREEAPGVSVRFVPNTGDDPALLRDGASDLAVGIYGSLPDEMRSRVLLTDRFVCAVRKRHPTVGKRLTLEQFTRLAHIQIAPRGKPGGYVDDVLRKKGLERTVARAVPYFVAALEMVAQTDYVLTVSERIASSLADKLGLVLFPVPVELQPYALSLVWHPRLDGDPAQRFLRNVFIRAAAETAGDRHAGARTRLDNNRKKPRRRGQSVRFIVA